MLVKWAFPMSLSGSFKGGDVVHVHGTGFLPSKEFQCRFGDNVVPATFLGETYASCVVPTSRHPGKVSFEITTNGVDFSDSKISYEYHNRVVMAVAVPEQGPSNGGTSVTIYGSNFENTTRLRCRFGNLAVNATFQSRSEIVCMKEGTGGWNREREREVGE